MALQQPLIVYPALEDTVDATSTVDFYLRIRGTQCTRYTIYIYDVATNTQKYTSNLVLDTPLQDGEMLTIPVDMSSGSLGANNYYWQIRLYYDSTNYITTTYYTFNASSPPSIDFATSVPSTITTPAYTFIGSYSQAEGVQVKYFEIILRGNNGQTLATSGRVSDSPNNIRHRFNGLISGQSYSVQIIGATQQDVEFATGITPFNVLYIVPKALVNPKATLNPDSSITIDTGKIYAINGTTNGNVSYEPNYLYTGNVGLNLEDEDANVQFEVNFSPPFTAHWLISIPIDFSGVLGIIRGIDDIYYASLGYDGTRFYLDVNGDLYYDTAHALSGGVYIVGIIHDGITIKIRHKEAM